MNEPPDLEDIARRYLDLWEQHLSETAIDPEIAAGLAKLAGMTLPVVPGNASRTDPSGVVSGGGDGDYDDLSERVAALEKRLEALEREAAGPRREPPGKSR